LNGFNKPQSAIMNSKAAIKVIKRGEAKPAASKTAKTQTAAQAVREMAANVSEWVAEFQQKRRQETQQTLNKFFPKTSTPTGFTG
jgi:hypothetical protein